MTFFKEKFELDIMDKIPCAWMIKIIEFLNQPSSVVIQMRFLQSWHYRGRCNVSQVKLGEITHYSVVWYNEIRHNLLD